MVAAHGGSWDDDKAHSIVGLDLRDSARVIQTAGGVPLEVDDIVERLLDSVIRRSGGRSRGGRAPASCSPACPPPACPARW